MSNENENKPKGDDESAQATPAEKTKQEDERRFTQEQVNELVKKAKAQQDRSTRRKLMSEPDGEKHGSNSGQKQDDGEVAALKARLEAMEKSNAFDRALTRVPGASELNEVQRTALQAMFDPNEPDTLAGKAKALFGEPKASKPKDEGEEAMPQVPQAMPQAISAGAPSPGERDLGAIHPKDWTSDEIRSMKQQRTEDGRSMLRATIEKWARNLPGGAPDLFRARIPKG